MIHQGLHKGRSLISFWALSRRKSVCWKRRITGSGQQPIDGLYHALFEGVGLGAALSAATHSFLRNCGEVIELSSPGIGFPLGLGQPLVLLPELNLIPRWRLMQSVSHLGSLGVLKGVPYNYLSLPPGCHERRAGSRLISKS
jgi:hypothetical protein